MRDCRACGAPIEASFRFCPWCAAPQRLKLTEFFRGHPGIAGSAARALRVSRYFGAEEERHVRVSVWNGGATEGEARVEAALSLQNAEADRLGRFLLALPALETRSAAEIRRSTGR